jgi:hypothetical protein
MLVLLNMSKISNKKNQVGQKRVIEQINKNKASKQMELLPVL